MPNTSATAASSGADLNGMAVLAACEAIRGRIAAFLVSAGEDHALPLGGAGADGMRGLIAAAAGRDAAEIEFAGGTVGLPGARIAFADAVRLAYANRVQLSATGFYKTPDIVWDREAGRGRPFYYFAYGCGITEVVIDTLTGENRILRADLLHDAGASLNPALDIGQIEGGYVQGAGWLTTEELVWDGKGRLATHAPSTYKIPACSDRPRVFNVDLWDKPNPENTVHRSKAVGEPPLMLGIGAFLALEDACAACGPGLAGPAGAGDRRGGAGGGGAGAGVSFVLDAEELGAALDAHGRVARVVVVDTRGSAPRRAGTAMLVFEAGQSGTIGGGALEWRAAADARALLASGGGPRVDRHALGPGMGQCCGGAVTLVTEVLEAVPEGPVRVLRTKPAGAVPVWAPEVPGWRDGTLVERVGSQARTLWIWGAGHVGRAIAAVVAPLGTHAVTVIDLSAKLDGLPAGTPLPCADMPALAAHAPKGADHLILTHDHAIDLALCDALLRRRFTSCGLIGSATKRARFDARLRAMGHPNPFGPIECPIGDPALGKHPQAIAIGVARRLIRGPEIARVRS